MSDRLVQLSKNPTARKIIKGLGLPVPLPQALRRDLTPWRERPLDGRDVVVGSAGESAQSFILEALANAGAAVHQAAAETPHALVFDATEIKTPEALSDLWAFFHPRLRSLGRCGRVIVIGRPTDEITDVLEASAQRALDGFVKSVGREIGRKGATALLITVQDGAEARAASVLRFFLSDRSTYVTGQVVRVTNMVREAQPLNVQPLQGKIALVTGAAQGIGAATARLLAREGAKVIVLDRPAAESSASAVAAEIDGVTLLVDVTEDDAAEKIAAFVEEKFGGVDVIIHNAGITRDKTLAKMESSWWDQTIGVNLIAVHRMNEALESLINEGGRIVCLSSISGIAGNVGQTNYAASKAGIIGLVEALAVKLAARGIAVNAVAPGFIETQMTAAIPAATREVARRLSNLFQGGQPQDVAEVLTFLSSPNAAGVSGQVLRVCGGNFVGA